MDAESAVEGPRPEAVRLVQRDYESGEFGVLEAARDKLEFKDFACDDLMVEANAEVKTSTKW